MIESVSQIGIEAAQAGSSSSAVTDPKASSSDVRAFEAKFQQQAGGTEQTAATEATNATQGVSQTPESMRSLLAAFDKLNGGAESVRSLAEKVGAGGEFSPSQVIELTMYSHKFMFQSQLTSNVANRTSDGIQQLFRQQS